MNLSFSAEQQMLRDSAFSFVRSSYDFSSRLEALSEPAGYSSNMWRQFADLGWLGWPIAEDDGGHGGTLADTAIIAEALGSCAAVEPYLECAVLGAGLLAALGEGRQRRYLRDISSGGCVAVFAHGEGNSHDRAEVCDTTAVPHGRGWRLDGEKRIVVAAQAADLFLVSARVDEPEQRVAVFAVAKDAPGLEISSFPILDGRHAADVRLRRVEVAQTALLGGLVDASASIEKLLDVGTALNCAQILGALDELLRETWNYVDSRVQFGRTLAKFQVVQHRLAEMRTRCEEARAMTLMAILRLDADAAERGRAVSAAKVIVGDAARFVGHQAVQLHGGMGVSEELKIGTYLKFISVFRLTHGRDDWHLERYRHLMNSGEICVADPIPGDATSALGGLTLDLGADLLSFREEIRRLIEAELTEDTRRAARLNVAPLYEPAISRAWHDSLHRCGWAAPEWPRVYGGKDWDPIQHYVWRVETWRAGAPPISQLGMRLVAPIILTFGTDDQKARFLPGLLTGESWWCQGFSEPGAGSDLAALKCAAVRQGDDYVVNGTKLWQTHAQFADWMILLVRTSTTDDRRDGITCLLVDMNTPGVDVQPIITIGGDHEVNQVFLDDVRVPIKNRVGSEGDGWKLAMHVLSLERASSGNSCGRLRFHLAEALRVIESEGVAESGATSVGSLERKFARIAMDIDAIEMLELALLFAEQNQEDPRVLTSIIKLRASQVEQDVCETTLIALGERALRWHPHRPLYELEGDEHDLQRLAIGPRYLNSRIRTIFGGATEIQLGIIAQCPLR